MKRSDGLYDDPYNLDQIDEEAFDLGPKPLTDFQRQAVEAAQSAGRTIETRPSDYDESRTS